MEKKKSLLLITPFFAPQTHAAVFRAYKLVKILAKRDWKIFVVTVDINYYYNEDENLLKELPSHVAIFPCRFIEPTIRGLRMLFGGRARTFKAIKPKDNYFSFKVDESNQSKWSLSSIYLSLKKAYSFFLHNFIFYPDAYWTWKYPAIKKSRELIKNNEIDLILTSSFPFSTIEIGYKLKKEFSIKWIADFRDPLTYDHRIFSKNILFFYRQRKIEKKALKYADKITSTSSSLALILADTYGLKNISKVHFIPTGLDADYLSEENSVNENNGVDSVDTVNGVNNIKFKDEDYLIFIGEFQKFYGDEFFKILKNIKIKWNKEIKLKIVGRKEINTFHIKPILQKFEIEHLVEFIDHLPQKELYQLIKKSKAGLLNVSRYYPWWCCFAKMTDYLALQKFVIALVPDPSESRKWLLKSGLGIFLDGSIDEAGETLYKFYNNDFSYKINQKVCNKFLATQQVNEFEKIFTCEQ